MDFEAIILEHMGKDIYIGVEDSQEHSRQEAVFHAYQVMSLDGGPYQGFGEGFVCSGDDRKKRMRLELQAKLVRWERLFDMIDIEARYQRYFYHIYIMGYINEGHSSMFGNSSAQDFAPAAKSVRMCKGWKGIRPVAVWRASNGRIL